MIARARYAAAALHTIAALVLAGCGGGRTEPAPAPAPTAAPPAGARAGATTPAPAGAAAAPGRADSAGLLATSARDSVVRPSPAALDSLPLSLRAVLSERKLYVRRGAWVIKAYDVAVGQDDYPTPLGHFSIRHMIWNPGWKPPPESEWAKGKKPREPSDPQNPMKAVKIFFQDPDYYIHGTDQIESLGSAASHGCLRMHPGDVTALAVMLMEAGGAKKDWAWVKRVLHLGATREVVLRHSIPIDVMSDPLAAEPAAFPPAGPR